MAVPNKDTFDYRAGYANGKATMDRSYMDRINDLEAIINRINEHADVMLTQVGTGVLVSNIRQGFQTIIDITREATS